MSKQLWAILDECAVHEVVGSRKTTAGQLTKPLELSELPHFVIRVLPRESDAHIGLDGGFTVMKMTNGQQYAYVEAPEGGRLGKVPNQLKFAMRYEQVGQQAPTSRGLPRTHQKDLGGALSVWRKSTHSGTGSTGGEDCVEVQVLESERGA